MTDLTPARTRIAMLALALGGFSIGATEFIAMGLLPEIARDLLPTLYAASSEDAIARAGWLITAYAVGVVVGAPTIAAAAARFPRRTLLIVLTVGFTVGLGRVGRRAHVRARGRRAVRRGARARGVLRRRRARRLAPARARRSAARPPRSSSPGLTIASVVGVPSITYLGQHAGWRWAYVVVAALFALTTLAIVVVRAAPRGRPARDHPPRTRRLPPPRRLVRAAHGLARIRRVLRRLQLRRRRSRPTSPGMSSSFVPVVLMVLGAGTTVGILGGGRLADRGAVRAIFILFGAFAASLLFLGLTARSVRGCSSACSWSARRAGDRAGDPDPAHGRRGRQPDARRGRQPLRAQHRQQPGRGARRSA